MNRLIIVLLTICMSSVAVGPAHAEAEVETDTIVNGYFMDNFEGNLQYRSAGASDLNFLGLILNIGWGCSFPIDLADMDENRLHDVLTPSENTNQTTNGPIWHAVWPVGPGPCNPADWVAFGYGQFSNTNSVKATKDSFSSRFTASGFFPDLAGFCEGDFVAYSAIWHVAGKNNAADCDLNPFAPDVSGCDKVKEKVHLECPDL